jgi:hypothetical protein
MSLRARPAQNKAGTGFSEIKRLGLSGIEREPEGPARAG